MKNKMQGFMKKITDWMLDKEEEMAKKCAIPPKEIEYQLKKLEDQKAKIQKEYDEAMATLNEVEVKIKHIQEIEENKSCEK